MNICDIIKTLRAAKQFLEAKGYEVISINLYGSQNYGLDTPSSDLDFKAVVAPHLNDVINNIAPVSTSIEFNDGLIDIKDIRLMCENYKKQNTGYLETLFTDYYICSSEYAPEWEKLRKIAENITQADKVKAVKAFYGMMLQKQEALCHPYPSKIELIHEYGYDAKQLSHIVRLDYMLKNFIDPCPPTYKSLLELGNDENLISLLKNIKSYKVKLTPKEVQKIAADYVKTAKRTVDTVVELKDCFPILTGVYKEMDEIKSAIIKRSFIKELL